MLTVYTLVVGQGTIDCASLVAGLRGSGEFERIFEEIIQNEVSLGGSPTINGTLL